jgi:hypothetical protein
MQSILFFSPNMQMFLAGQLATASIMPVARRDFSALDRIPAKPPAPSAQDDEDPMAMKLPAA